MPSHSLDREKRILEYLHNNKKASIQDLAEAFNVSVMTIHRDLGKLEIAGHVQKKHGGVILLDTSMGGSSQHPCDMCQKPVSERTMFLVTLENGEQRRACCAHCGLMLQSRTPQVWQSLTPDFLHGHMVSAGQAVFLIESDLNICCVPSILTFGSWQDAEKFQKGFGGQLLGMDEALQYFHGTMNMPSGMSVRKK